jgi:hypothetical protein
VSIRVNGKSLHNRSGSFEKSYCQFCQLDQACLTEIQNYFQLYQALGGGWQQ